MSGTMIVIQATGQAITTRTTNITFTVWLSNHHIMIAECSLGKVDGLAPVGWSPSGKLARIPPNLQLAGHTL
jgi:hypothetical protein